MWQPGQEVVIQRRSFDRKTSRLEELRASYISLDIARSTFLEEPKVVPKALFLCVEDLAGAKYTSARDL